jgi:hypothetical protein
VPAILPLSAAGVEEGQSEIAKLLLMRGMKDAAAQHQEGEEEKEEGVFNSDVMTYLASGRLNMNVRQVVHEESDLL